MRSGVRTLVSTATALAVAAAVVVPVQATGASATTPAASAVFYRYDGSRPLASYAPGAVLKTRTMPYSLAGVPLPLTVVQILYRTADAQGRPSANVTSLVKAPLAASPDKLVAYQSFYDSLNPEDGPSRAIAGGTSGGTTIPDVETALIAPFLLQGESVVIADTEGATADFAAGAEYGQATLDSIRAVSNSPATGISRTAKVGLIGYSGGAIATDWAAALAPSYAPDVNRRLIGATEGGVLVDPAHNLHYIQGSTVWAGVLVMALIGAARAYGISLAPYENAYGQALSTTLQDAPISSVLAAYPGLTWTQIAKPQYPQPESIPVYRTIVNKLNLGSRPSPTVPMFIGQGANGALEGTSGTQAGIGAGDGVMITGDVRTLARQYCSSGTTVRYQQYDATSHFTTVPLWAPDAIAWLAARFAGVPAPSSCGSIPAGNALTPVG